MCERLCDECKAIFTGSKQGVHNQRQPNTFLKTEGVYVWSQILLGQRYPFVFLFLCMGEGRERDLATLIDLDHETPYGQIQHNLCILNKK